MLEEIASLFSLVFMFWNAEAVARVPLLVVDAFYVVPQVLRPDANFVWSVTMLDSDK